MFVKPLLQAVSKPFSKVSLNSNPGSPKEIFGSNQPDET